MIVLDASVATKWFHGIGEENRDRALHYLRLHLDGQLTIHVPDLLLYEVANALLCKAELGSDMVLSALESLAEYNLVMHWPGLKGIRAGTEIAAELALSVYDASYVALSRELRIPLITADKKLVRKARQPDDVVLLSAFEL